jgi:site-specific recombinase XerC
LAWRADLEKRGLAGATIRRKLAALASLFDHLLENNTVAGGNPVHGVKGPKIESNEGKTPALGDYQAFHQVQVIPVQRQGLAALRYF